MNLKSFLRWWTKYRILFNTLVWTCPPPFSTPQGSPSSSFAPQVLFAPVWNTVTGGRHIHKIVIIMAYVVRRLLTIFNILQSLTTLSQGQLAPHLGTQTASLADFFTSEPVLSHSPRPTMQSTTASTWRGLSGAEETGVDAIWSHCRSRHGSQQQFHTVLHLSGNYTSLH